MEEIDIASQKISLEAKWFQEFDVVDPFNDTAIRGFLSNKPDYRYGALVITHVNDKPVPQVIFGTPKLHYPFNRLGEFIFPPIREIEIYDKIDGTNVLAYQYVDAEQRSYITYKLRLYPVLRNGRFGDFLDMWSEMLVRYPVISDLIAINDCSLSFELYGRRNVHLIIYEEALNCALLFGINKEGEPVFPSVLDSRDVPIATFYGKLEAGKDPVKEYARIREELENKNQPAEDDKITGSEGTVWYVLTEKKETVLFKCKPESVEQVHWVAGISKEVVTATCWNLFETQDVLNYETLYPLLLEDYSADEIEGFRAYIDECIAGVNREMDFRNRVLSEYKKLGIKLSENKREVMRTLSKLFKKQEMKKVFTIIANNEKMV